MFTATLRTVIYVGAALMLSATASADTTPRHISELDRGFLAAPTGRPPEMTALAGDRFDDLVPDSRSEVCRIVLEHHARKTPGLYRLRIVDGSGRSIMVCSL
jgi:hypothetical protein